MAPRTRLHLAVALEGTGWHPAAWREPEARSRELLTAVYWTDLVREAEAGRMDFATIEDSLSLQSSTYDGIDGVRTRCVDASTRCSSRPGSHRTPGGSAWCRRRRSPTPNRSICPRRSRRSTT